MESRNEEIKIVAMIAGTTFFKWACGYLIRRRWGEGNVVVVRISDKREGEKSGDKEERWRVRFCPKCEIGDP